MSKNHAGLLPAGKFGFWNFFLLSSLKTVVICRIADNLVGLTGLEPVTLRLSSACSNQLSYRPGSWLRVECCSLREENSQLSTINSQLDCGGMGIRTPDL